MLTDCAMPTTVRVMTGVRAPASAFVGGTSLGPPPSGARPPAHREPPAQRRRVQGDRLPDLETEHLRRLPAEHDLAGAGPPAAGADRDVVDRGVRQRTARNGQAVEGAAAERPERGSGHRPRAGARRNGIGGLGRGERGVGRRGVEVDDEVRAVRARERLLEGRLGRDQDVQGEGGRTAREEQHDGEDSGLEPATARSAVAFVATAPIRPPAGSWAGRPRSSVDEVDDPVGVPLGELLVVGDEQDRLAAAVEVVDEGECLVPVPPIERAGRLVGEQHRRPVHDRPGQRHALAFAAAQRRREVARLGRQAELAEQVVDRAPRGSPGGARELCRDGDVVANAQVVEEVEELEHEPDPGSSEAGRIRLAQPIDPHAVDEDLAARGPVEAADQVEERGLATARRAHDRGDGPGHDVEIDRVEGGRSVGGVALGDTAKADERFHAPEARAAPAALSSALGLDRTHHDGWHRRVSILRMRSRPPSAGWSVAWPDVE